MTLLGLAPRWRTPLGDRVVTFAPRPCGNGLVTRAGAALFGLERDDGQVRWQTTIPDGGGLTACFTVIEDVAITEVRDAQTKRSHIYGYGPDGQLRWRTTLDAMARDVVRGGPHEVVAIVDASPKQLVTIDTRDGATTTIPLPLGGSNVVRLSATRWLLGSRVPGRGKPACYVLDGTTTTVLATDHPVWAVAATTNVVLVAERDGKSEVGILVARDAITLDVLWKQPILDEVFAAVAASVIVTLGTTEAARPAALDLVSGEMRWEAASLPKRAVRISAAPPLVLIRLSSDGGARSLLYTLEGSLRGSYEGETSKDVVVAGDTAYMTVDGDAVGLALSET